MPKIKLIKKAQWCGVEHKAGSVHDLTVETANRLVSRGYAKAHKEGDDDASGKRSGSGDISIDE